MQLHNKRTESARIARGSRAMLWPARSWLLTLLAVLAGAAAGVVAVMLDGTASSAFAGAAIVFFVTAFFCAGITSLESHSGPAFELDEPPPTPPVPQSQVTLIYDPKGTPNNSLEREAAKINSRVRRENRCR